MGGKFARHPGGFQVPPQNVPYTTDNFVTREEWGAAPPDRESLDLKHPIEKIRYGSTNTEMCYKKEDCIKIVKKLQEEHIDIGGPDIFHNFLVGGDGNVYEGKGWFKEGCIPQEDFDLQGRTLDVCLIGPFYGGEVVVPKDMIRTARSIVNYGRLHNYIKEGYDAQQYDSDSESDVGW